VVLVWANNNTNDNYYQLQKVKIAFRVSGIWRALGISRLGYEMIQIKKRRCSRSLATWEGWRSGKAGAAPRWLEGHCLCRHKGAPGCVSEGGLFQKGRRLWAKT
jgi:hypothetical protein